MNSSINFFSEGTLYRIRKKNVIRHWVEAISANEKVVAGDINFIFVNDEILFKINRKYLKVNTLTDIVSFSFSEDESVISGDIYISIQRVKENSKQFKESFTRELHRVIIHGVLHLAGYEDRTEDEKKIMRRKEEECLKILNRIENNSPKEALI